MGFSFNLFGSSSHRQFNYKPRYYDVEAEERRKFFGSHADAMSGQESISGQENDSEKTAEAGQNREAGGVLKTGAAAGKGQAGTKAGKPGRYITGSFRPGNYQKETSHNTMVTTVIGIISLILIFVVLIYIARFYAFLIG